MIELEKQQPEFEKKILTQKQLRLNNFSLGIKGEQKARKFLVSLGYKIIDQNLRVKNHEIDLIAHDTNFDEIVFVEVKTRKTNFFGNPADAVNKKKIRSMKIVAKNYMKLHSFHKDFRFDIIAISANDIEHFENISWGM